MLKKITGLFFILMFLEGIHSTALSQEIQIGYFFQPQYSTLNNNQVSSTTKIEQNQTFNAYTGFSATYFFNEKIGLGTGISYGHDGQKFIYQKSTGLSVVRSSHHYIFKMMRFPITVRYIGKIGKIRLLVDGGPQFCYQVKTSDKTSTQTLDYSENYARFQIAFQVATGIGIQITDQFMVYLKPNFEITNYSFNHTVENIDQDFPLGKNINGNSAGLQLGITWMKKKP